MTDKPTTAPPVANIDDRKKPEALKAAAEPERVSIYARLAQDELEILERSAAAGTPRA